MSDTSAHGFGSLCGSLLGLTTLTLGLRLYARYMQRRVSQFMLDDWLAVASWITFIGLIGESFWGIEQGFMGYPEPLNKTIVEEQQAEMAKVYFTLDAIEVWTLGLAKLSALFFYRRIFCNGPHDAFHIINIMSIVIVVLWIATFFTLNFSICGSTLTSLWNGGIPKCSRLYSYLEATAISDFILDLWIISLPLPNIWSLRVPIRRKVAISAVFLFALVGLGASATRMALYIYLITRGRAINDIDSYQSNTILAFYAILEAGLSIIAVNLPSMWYFVREISPDHMVRSVRSILPLLSGRQSRSSRSGTDGDKANISVMNVNALDKQRTRRSSYSSLDVQSLTTPEDDDNGVF